MIKMMIQMNQSIIKVNSQDQEIISVKILNQEKISQLSISWTWLKHLLKMMKINNKAIVNQMHLRFLLIS